MIGCFVRLRGGFSGRVHRLCSKLIAAGQYRQSGADRFFFESTLTSWPDDVDTFRSPFGHLFGGLLVCGPAGGRVRLEPAGLPVARRGHQAVLHRRKEVRAREQPAPRTLQVEGQAFRHGTKVMIFFFSYPCAFVSRYKHFFVYLVDILCRHLMALKYEQYL